MNAGKLDKRVTFQTATRTKNADHEPVLTWSDAITVWAQVMPLSGREMIEAQQVQSESSIKIKIRPRSDIDENMRFLYLSRAYEIDYVPPYDPKSDMIILGHSIDPDLV